MIEEDTIKLLRECDQGIKMGISSIDQVISYVSSEKMKNVFLKSKMEHSKIENEIEEMLSRFQDEGKNPNIFVQGMSKMKTNIELMINDSDYKIASIMAITSVVMAGFSNTFLKISTFSLNSSAV